MDSNIGARLLPLPLTADALDLRIRSLRVMRDVVARAELKEGMDRLGLRERRNQMLRTEGRRGIEVAATELMELRNAGASRAELLQMVGWLGEVVEDLFDGAPVDLSALELAEVASDLEEDAAQMRAHLGAGETDQDKMERARKCRRHADDELSLARALEGDVRRRALGIHRRTA